MSDFVTFLQLGFHHIVDVSALDHILFLLALAAIYRRADWREGLTVISAFTVGHSITLALVAVGAMPLSTRLIEFLIPVTIVATGIDNVVAAGRRHSLSLWRRPLLAGAFGLVHGAGFANYLRSAFSDSIALPLFGFNAGIELGQILLLALASLAFAAVDRLAGELPLSRTSALPSGYRMRTLAVSAIVIVLAAQMMVTREPW